MVSPSRSCDGVAVGDRLGQGGHRCKSRRSWPRPDASRTLNAGWLLRGGQVIDGTGAHAYRADVRIEQDRIADIGGALTGDRQIDIRGQTAGDREASTI